MYMAFILRLFNVYKNSIYKLPNITLIFVLSYIIISCVVIVYFDWTAIDVFESYGSCHGIIPIWILFMWWTNDIITASILLYLFLKRIYKITRITIKNTHINSQVVINDYKNIAIKLSVLTSIALFTEILYIVIILWIIPNFQIVIPIDMIVNIISMSLMTPFYNDKIFFQRLCCLCVGCCKFICYIGVDRKTIQLADITSKSQMKLNTKMIIQIVQQQMGWHSNQTHLNLKFGNFFSLIFLLVCFEVLFIFFYFCKKTE